jgi:hypothetical protein
MLTYPMNLLVLFALIINMGKAIRDLNYHSVLGWLAAVICWLKAIS